MPSVNKLRINGVEYDLSGGGGGTSNYNDLNNKPKINGNELSGNKTSSQLGFGTASEKNVPASGNAASTEVVLGNDTRLSDSRPASDVYDWAKAATKPTYTKSEVGLSDVPNVTTDNQTPTVTEASTRANIASGDNLKTIIGKIKKYFTDLKDLAFIAKDGTSSSTTKYLRGDGTWQAFPTIPTVNNGTLTIQKNGTNVQTFTANQSGNATANITVPTKTSELTNNSNFVVDANYVHTDNNFTNTYKNSIDNLKDLAFIAVDNTPSDMPKYLQSDGTWQEFPIATVNYAGFMANYHVQKLGTIQQGAEVNVQSDWTETDTTKDSYIQNVPTWVKSSTKPTYTSSEVGLGNVPNVATNDQKPTFTQASSRTNLVSGTDTLSTIMGKIMKWFADLKTVAFTGSYNNLIDKPTIGNGTLTVQKNGTTIDTFTANATGNKTINVTVPTKLSELTSDANHRTVTDTQIATFSGSATWGAISGTLSNQNDLTDALNDKLDKTGGNVGPLTVENEWSSGEIENATLLYYGVRLYYSGGPSQSAYTVYLGDTVLWTNLSPTSSFTAQTVTLGQSLENFDYWEVVFGANNGSDANTLSTGLLSTKALLRTRLLNIGGVIDLRDLQVSGTTVTFEAGKRVSSYNGSLSNRNQSCIPLQIIGFKFHN